MLAAAAGLFLATLPFWRYLPLGGVLGAHMDHEPRHGGQLGMTGDHHIEVVRRRGQVEVFVSDALRLPIAPASGVVIFDRGTPAPLTWENHRLIAPDRPAASEIEVRVRLHDGKQLALSFDFGLP
jgi:hypothetical protein